MSPQDPLLLWDLAPEDHAAYVATGCGTETFEQYSAAIEHHEAYAKTTGREVVKLRLGVDQVVAEVQKTGMVVSPGAAGLAVRLLYNQRRGQGSGAGAA